MKTKTTYPSKIWVKPTIKEGFVHTSKGRVWMKRRVKGHYRVIKTLDKLDRLWYITNHIR
ncbi:MAG: hypothetical protein IFNCLDLE_02693 [Ignavibacteriaceae bacterium]|nr:hypothetical protein [Ignavibacteriaceae bacterium]